MSVRIRMKKLGRAHRPFFRICAMDRHSPRDGRVLEELGTYDPLVPDTDARAVLKADRIDYWIGVGAQPSENVAVLIKKYGTNGTHVDAQKVALARLSQPKAVPEAGAPASLPQSAAKEEAPAAAAAPAPEAAPAAEATPAAEEAPAAEATAAVETPATEAPAAEAAEAKAEGEESKSEEKSE